jgi:ankyrin repeat protein
MEAVWQGRLNTAVFLLQRGADLCRTDNHDGTALWQAAKSNQVEMVKLFMKHGGRDCKDAAGALSAAVERNQTEVAKELLEGGVDPTGLTATPQILPLEVVALRNGNRGITQRLNRWKRASRH